jgi:inner membrane protein
MYRSGHVGISLLLYAPVLIVTGVFVEALFPLAILGSFLLVDPLLVVVLLTKFTYSKVLFHLSQLSISLSTVQDADRHIPGVEHRGITHTIWFAAGMGVVTGIFGTPLVVVVGAPVSPEEGLGVLGATVLCLYIGLHAGLSHLLADVLTPAGIQPLSPWSERHFTLNAIRADNTIANLGTFFVGIFTTFFAVITGILL